MIKNGAKRSKLDQKWSQEEQKLEADRARWPKTAPKSRPGGPNRAMVESWGSKMEAKIDQQANETSERKLEKNKQTQTKNEQRATQNRPKKNPI